MINRLIFDKKVSIIGIPELSTQRILAIRRAPEEDGIPGHDWAFITETYEEEDDDNLAECACRGLDEEVNIQASPSDLYRAGRRSDNGTLCGQFILPVRDRDQFTIRYQTEEVVDHKWVRPGEFAYLLQGSPFMDQAIDFIMTIESLCF